MVRRRSIPFKGFGLISGGYVLGGGLKHFLFTPRIFGEMIQFDEHIFQRGWFNHQLEGVTYRTQSKKSEA